jgi:hypothetical protein
MKELIDRKEIRDHLDWCKQWSKVKDAIMTPFTKDCIKAINTEGEATEEEIDTAIDLYLKNIARKISHEQFVRELTVYRDFFRLHGDQCGLDVVNKLINDRKIYDKCVKVTDGSFFEARILFLPHRTHMLQVYGDIKEGTSWKDVINQLYRNYEFIPCHWNSYDSVFDLDTDIIGGEIFDYYKMGMKT